MFGLWKGCRDRAAKSGAKDSPQRRKVRGARYETDGLLLVDGCSHSGIEAILEAASEVDPRTEVVFGGLHLVTTPLSEIDVLVEKLKTKWKVQEIAPGHCTGEPAFARLRKAYGENYLYAGLGTTVELK